MNVHMCLCIVAIRVNKQNKMKETKNWDLCFLFFWFFDPIYCFCRRQPSPLPYQQRKRTENVATKTQEKRNNMQPELNKSFYIILVENGALVHRFKINKKTDETSEFLLTDDLCVFNVDAERSDAICRVRFVYCQLVDYYFIYCSMCVRAVASR